GFCEPALVVEHVVGDAEGLCNLARIMDVLAGATASLAPRRLAVVVELQRDADDLVARSLHQRRRDRGINASGHGDDDAHAGAAAAGEARAAWCVGELVRN